MKTSTIILTFSLIAVGCGKSAGGNDGAASMTCGEFIGLAGTVTQQDVARTKSTAEQFDTFKPIIAHHAGMLASAKRFSEKGLQFARSKDRLPWLVGNSFEMTRSFCIGREQDEMKDVAIEQFDYLLAAAANQAPPSEMTRKEQVESSTLDLAQSEPEQKPPIADANAAIVGTWEGWEEEGERWQTVMKVERSGDFYEVALEVRGPGCIGSIDGTATFSKNTLLLVKKDDDRVCTITAKIDGTFARVSQDNCSSYHGAKCDFGASLSKSP